MDPLGSLRRDHTLIARVSDALEQFGKRLREDPPPPRSDLKDFAHFITDFAEDLHHVKEEDILLPKLAGPQMNWDSGPIGKVRQEHDHETYFATVLRNAAEQATSWSSEDLRRIDAAISDYVAFQRNHMRFEELYLYPSARAQLDEKSLQELEAKLKKFDDTHLGDEKRAEYEELADRLCEAYARSGVPSSRRLSQPPNSSTTTPPQEKQGGAL